MKNVTSTVSTCKYVLRYEKSYPLLFEHIFFTSQKITVEKYHRCFILKNTFAGVCVCHMLYFS